MIDPRSILITGASSGIGAALAAAYAKPGISLFLSGQNRERLGQTADSCRARGAMAQAAIVDVRDRQAMADWLADADGQAPLDLVIANAGVSGGLLGTEREREIWAVNVDGVLNTIGPAIPPMTARGHGQVAVMSSLAGLRGLPSAPAYSATKNAVRAYGEALRPRLAPLGLEVNVILPGFIESRITAANRFYMPMLMTADAAALKIRQGLERNKARIAFPAPLYWPMRVLACLPPWLADPLLARAPEKTG